MRRLFAGKKKQMRKMLFLVAMSAAMLTASSGAKAQVDLSTYADPKDLSTSSFDMRATRRDLAGSGRPAQCLVQRLYNGLAKRHYMDIRKGREAEHELIVYCKANPQLRIIQALDIVFKSMRERAGIKVQ